MKYKDFIEEFFLIDEAKSGQLVPFKFNKTQDRYYQMLCEKYDIENKGVASCVRDVILKARRQGFTSLILGLFAADDLLSNNPTTTLVISYKDDATKVFRNRYSTFIRSFFAKKFGVTNDKQIFKVNDEAEKVLAHNGARFFCGTASAKVGERGGVLHKLLFSEVAYYPDLEKITAKEIVEGTLRQVDIQSGMVFLESTGNGAGNYYAELWGKATNGESRFRPIFFSWRDFYSQEQFDLIKSEFVEEESLKREYPENPDEALTSSITSFVSKSELQKMVDNGSPKKLLGWVSLVGTDYMSQAEILTHSIKQLEEQNYKRDLYIGIDVAKVNDSTVMTILSVPAPFGSKGGIKAVAIDATGVGDFLPDYLNANTNWYIIPIKITSVQNDILYKNLNQVIKNGLTSLPNLEMPEGKEFINQMVSLGKELRGELIRVSAPNGDNYHDDYADSWALAESAFFELNGLPVLPKQPDGTTLTSRIMQRFLNRDGRRTAKQPEAYE